MHNSMEFEIGMTRRSFDKYVAARVTDTIIIYSEL